MFMDLIYNMFHGYKNKVPGVKKVHSSIHKNVHQFETSPIIHKDKNCSSSTFLIYFLSFFDSFSPFSINVLKGYCTKIFTRFGNIFMGSNEPFMVGKYIMFMGSIMFTRFERIFMYSKKLFTD
jgi:hypothetical protein